MKDFGTYLLWGFLMIIATAIPALLTIAIWQSSYHKIFYRGGMPEPSQEGAGVLTLFSGLVAGLLLLRCTKDDVHRSEFFGILSGIILDIIGAFIMIVFPDILNTQTFQRAFIPMVALGIMIFVALYVVGPYAIALNERYNKKNSL